MIILNNVGIIIWVILEPFANNWCGFGAFMATCRIGICLGGSGETNFPKSFKSREWLRLRVWFIILIVDSPVNHNNVFNKIK
jgi:hypothetical protein